MATFSTHIESSERVVPLTMDEFREAEKNKRMIEELKAELIAEEEREERSEYDWEPAVHTNRIREIFGLKKDDGLKVMF